jgi:hypothetical protein
VPVTGNRTKEQRAGIKEQSKKRELPITLLIAL